MSQSLGHLLQSWENKLIYFETSDKYSDINVCRYHFKKPFCSSFCSVFDPSRVSVYLHVQKESSEVKVSFCRKSSGMTFQLSPNGTWKPGGEPPALFKA